MAFSSDKLFSDPFAYDLHKQILTRGEAYNDEAINISINNILSTIFSERLFKSDFGSYLQLTLFDTIGNTDHLESILESIIKSIKDWEDRVFVLDNQCRLEFDPDSQILSIDIVYIINKTSIRSSYSSNIRVAL